MSIVGGVVLVVGAYGLGFICCGLLTCGLVDDLRNLLAMLLESPNDECIREMVSDTLYQKDEG